MGRPTYSRRDCRCGKSISSAGAAKYNHMMSHVRKGEAKVLITPVNVPFGGVYEFQWLKQPKKFSLRSTTVKPKPIYEPNDLLFAIDAAAEFLDMEEWPEQDGGKQVAAYREAAKLIRKMGKRIAKRKK